MLLSGGGEEPAPGLPRSEAGNQNHDWHHFSPARGVEASEEVQALPCLTIGLWNPPRWEFYREMLLKVLLHVLVAHVLHGRPASIRRKVLERFSSRLRLRERKGYVRPGAFEGRHRTGRAGPC